VILLILLKPDIILIFNKNLKIYHDDDFKIVNYILPKPIFELNKLNLDTNRTNILKDLTFNKL